MKTEKEARECWCPFARVSIEGIADDQLYFAGNRMMDADGNVSIVVGATKCIASDCMAWWWEFQSSHNKGAEFTDQARGCCGLAGCAE